VSATTFQKYLLPGFVFQSLVIAGGYGTGREIVEFFLTYGPLGGLLAMVLVATVIWSLVSAVTFELARLFHTYDYRSFFRRLLGPGWVLFEIGYIVLLFLVLAVIGAAAGSLVQQTFHLPYAVGVLGIMLAVGLLVFWGTTAIERVLTFWSVVLYAVYAALFVASFAKFGPAIHRAFMVNPVTPGWAVGGVKYAAYNLAIIPAVLFVVRHIESRREAIWAGLLAGVIGILPGLLFYIAMVGHYPEIVGQSVPANYLLHVLGSRAFEITFEIVLFGTLIETGTGMIHAINERIAHVAAEKGKSLHRSLRPAIALAFLVTATLMTKLGLVNLIAKGYGTLTWLFLVVYVIPVLTIGVWIVAKTPGPRTAPTTP
jgi:uncharacterized membrane protein YkvI